MSVCHLNRAGTSTRCGATPNLGDSRDPADVTCPDCSQLIRDGEYREQHRRDWTVAAVAGDTELGFTDWLKEKLLGVGPSTPTLNLPNCHRPPSMSEGGDGVFIFYDVHIEGCSMEVVPQTTGNVEITVAYGADDGYLFTLSHLDRADLFRALLHDFHYSPEKDGPNDN